MAKKTSPTTRTAKKSARKPKGKSTNAERRMKNQKALRKIADTAIEEVRQRNYELQVINSIQQGLASRLELQAIIDLVGDKLRKILNIDDFGIRLYDKKTDLMNYLYVFEQGQREDVPSIPPNPMFRKMLEDRQPYFGSIEELVKKYNWDLKPDEIEHKSLATVPIISGDQVIGGITGENFEDEHYFNEANIRLMQTIAASMGVALENARLFDETQRLLRETKQRAAELSVINSVQEGLASKLNMQEIYELVGDKVREIFDANTVTLVTFDLDKNLICPHYGFESGRRLLIEPYPIPEVWKDFIRRRQTVLINSGLADYVQEIDPSTIPVAGEMPKSVLAVPLMVNGEIHGVVSLQNIDRENAFTESDVRILETLASGMSVALENARLWEQERIYRKALQRELEIGREIQAGFLPEELPQVEGWEIAASLMSAREVAGDFYDVFEFPDGNIGLVIADVCDKGVGAALFMTLFRSLIRAASNLDYFEHTEQINVPHSITERLQRAMSLTNNYIAETHGASGMFATLFFGILNPHDGKLAYINGGHEPPLIIQSGIVRENLHKTGSAVGAIMNCSFEILEIQIQPGDIFFAFTDGVPDCKNPLGNFFGREKLYELLQRHSGSSAQLVGTIETELHQYISSAPQFDDITLLAVRRIFN